MADMDAIAKAVRHLNVGWEQAIERLARDPVTRALEAAAGLAPVDLEQEIRRLRRENHVLRELLDERVRDARESIDIDDDHLGAN